MENSKYDKRIFFLHKLNIRSFDTIIIIIIIIMEEEKNRIYGLIFNALDEMSLEKLKDAYWTSSLSILVFKKNLGKIVPKISDFRSPQKQLEMAEWINNTVPIIM